MDLPPPPPPGPVPDLRPFADSAPRPPGYVPAPPPYPVYEPKVRRRHVRQPVAVLAVCAASAGLLASQLSWISAPGLYDQLADDAFSGDRGLVAVISAVLLGTLIGTAAVGVRWPLFVGLPGFLVVGIIAAGDVADLRDEVIVDAGIHGGIGLWLAIGASVAGLAACIAGLALGPPPTTQQPD